jgi:hypothetical protein
MSERSNALADELDRTVEDFARTVEKCSDEKWQATGPEGWTVAAIAQHVSGQFPLESEFITAAAEGRSLPTYSWDDINGLNDGRAAKNTNVSKQAVLNELRDNAAQMSAYVRNLSDEQLDRKSALPLAGGAEVTTQQLIEGGVLIDHLRGHQKSIEAAG